MSLARTLKLLDAVDGRDNVCKMVQEASRFMKHQSEGNEAYRVAFQGLFENMSNARKLFKLFRSFNEYITVRDLLKKDAPLDNLLPAAARLGYLFYWLFDNLTVLIKVKAL